MSVHKKIPGVFDSARDRSPVAHHDSSTLLGIYTHAMADSQRCSSGHAQGATHPQDTTPAASPAEAPTESTAWSGAAPEESDPDE
jgi:hypothetical protein